MGPPGAGLAAKLARNLITYGSWLAAFEAQELAEAAGIDLLKLGEAARESDKRIGGATRLMFRTTAAPWPAGSDEGLLELMRSGAEVTHKDLTTILELGDDARRRPPTGHAGRAALRPHLRLRRRHLMTGAGGSAADPPG